MWAEALAYKPAAHPPHPGCGITKDIRSCCRLVVEEGRPSVRVCSDARFGGALALETRPGSVQARGTHDARCSSHSTWQASCSIYKKKTEGKLRG